MLMGKVSIIGAYNTQFGAFIDRIVKEDGSKEIVDKKSFYELLNEAAQEIGRASCRERV